MIYVSVPGTPAARAGHVRRVRRRERRRGARPAAGLSDPRGGEDAAGLDRGRAIRATSDAGGDRHMLIVDRDHRILFELYHTCWDAAVEPLGGGLGRDLPARLERPPARGVDQRRRRRPRHPPRAGALRRGLRLRPDPPRLPLHGAADATATSSRPRTRRATPQPARLPMGARLRLKAGKDISGYPPEVRKIFQAMKTYGLILADNGTDMYITGTHDTRWDNDVLNPAFASADAPPTSRSIQLGWKPAPSGGSCAAVATPGSASNGSRFRVEAMDDRERRHRRRPRRAPDLGHGLLLVLRQRQRGDGRQGARRLRRRTTATGSSPEA